MVISCFILQMGEITCGFIPSSFTQMLLLISGPLVVCSLANCSSSYCGFITLQFFITIGHLNTGFFSSYCRAAWQCIWRGDSPSKTSNKIIIFIFVLFAFFGPMWTRTGHSWKWTNSFFFFQFLFKSPGHGWTRLNMAIDTFRHGFVHGSGVPRSRKKIRKKEKTKPDFWLLTLYCPSFCYSFTSSVLKEEAHHYKGKGCFCLFTETLVWGRRWEREEDQQRSCFCLLWSARDWSEGEDEKRWEIQSLF